MDASRPVRRLESKQRSTEEEKEASSWTRLGGRFRPTFANLFNCIAGDRKVASSPSLFSFDLSYIFPPFSSNRTHFIPSMFIFPSPLLPSSILSTEKRMKQEDESANFREIRFDSTLRFLFLSSSSFFLKKLNKVESIYHEILLSSVVGLAPSGQPSTALWRFLLLDELR